jgi:hypothetical protein
LSRRPSRFTQSDIARALRAAVQVGAHVAIEIMPDGTIRLVPGEKAKVAGDGQARNAAGYVEARLADAPWARSK